MLRLLTLNTWGTPYSSDVPVRMDATAALIKREQPDIIALQEVFLEPSRKQLLKALSDEWPHQHAFLSGMLGSGLLTLSRYPILDVNFYTFRMSGKPERIWQGDFYGRKGIGVVRLNTPDGLLDVYNTHTHAQYQPELDNEYALFTDTNLYEAARFINIYSRDVPVILCGDLNTRPEQLGYDLAIEVAQLVDFHAQLCPDDPGYTFCPDNHYVKSMTYERLDYVMGRNVQPASIGILNTPPEKTDGVVAFSDHYGLVATFDFARHQSVKSNTATKAEVISILDQRINKELAALRRQRSKYSERLLTAIAVMLDLLLFFGFYRRIVPFFTPRLRQWMLTVSLFYGGISFVYDQFNLRSREQTLRALQHEIRVHSANVADQTLPGTGD